ncbi:MAG TPA: DNA replication and repair protein RecF [Candidatus Saccharimonadales bacterium]|nr:DNA replication and repair protein RecF [Candidatus Saccharimonadales bacterium]
MITNIRLQNFRSYKDFSFEFEDGANIIVGPNASGKTNLLEAVMVLAQGSSYRAKNAQLIKHGCPWARLDGYFKNQNRTIKLEGDPDNPTKTLFIDDKPHKRLGLEQTLPLVYFEPEHLQSITRGPDRRRDYFDDILVRTRAGYRQTLNAYNRSLSQRNSLLKKGRSIASTQVFAWNIRLGELGSQIVSAREDITNQLNDRLRSVYGKIAGKRTKATVVYSPQFPSENYASRLISALEKSLDLDLDRGFTGSGPHRDDYLLAISDKPLAEHASRGEIRSLLLSLKKLELEMVEQTRGQKPILLLDDVLSELDGARRQALVEMLSDHQSILTTTDADTVLDYFASGSHKILALTK